MLFFEVLEDAAKTLNSNKKIFLYVLGLTFLLFFINYLFSPNLNSLLPRVLTLTCLYGGIAIILFTSISKTNSTTQILSLLVITIIYSLFDNYIYLTFFESLKTNLLTFFLAIFVSIFELYLLIFSYSGIIKGANGIIALSNAFSFIFKNFLRLVWISLVLLVINISIFVFISLTFELNPDDRSIRVIVSYFSLVLFTMLNILFLYYFYERLSQKGSQK